MAAEPPHYLVSELFSPAVRIVIAWAFGVDSQFGGREVQSVSVVSMSRWIEDRGVLAP